MTLEKQLSKANDQIKDFIKRDESVRIARDLHDTLGHTLSLITLVKGVKCKMSSKRTITMHTKTHRMVCAFLYAD